jgi:hypothetical protein
LDSIPKVVVMEVEKRHSCLLLLLLLLLLPHPLRNHPHLQPNR